MSPRLGMVWKCLLVAASLFFLLPGGAKADLLPTLDISGFYSFAKNGGGPTPGTITFSSLITTLTQYEDLSSCNNNSCDPIVSTALFGPFVNVTIGTFSQTDKGVVDEAFSSASISISDGTTTFLTGTIAAGTWVVDAAGTGTLVLNFTFDIDNLAITTLTAGSPASQFITEFATGVAAGAGFGNLPEIRIILNNFDFMGTTDQIAQMKITTPIPEPGTLLLLGSGLVSMWGFSRRQSRSRGTSPRARWS